MYRRGKWSNIAAEHLLPGDLVSMARSGGEDVIVPCGTIFIQKYGIHTNCRNIIAILPTYSCLDLLLLSGTAVVNEAMLTGESTPMMKVRSAVCLVSFHFQILFPMPFQLFDFDTHTHTFACWKSR